jgi:hypothetical protein
MVARLELCLAKAMTWEKLRSLVTRLDLERRSGTRGVKVRSCKEVRGREK